ncbi:hypothetical protein LAJ19_16860 (plasmid) [Deinococcus taeanensis]|uniref:hypothetical protein n=1 Tax=Deinococcus taeanensis TaxID=2737050 RepID=UPI001CDD35D0|nr:hypothetical protein [Deinococcus taeanensis]UBV44456.1 hypothetical protein LAJ19_16860 [Deinococcus taeanensis]
MTDAEWAAYERLAFLPRLLGQAGRRGNVPAEGRSAYQYGPVVVASAAGGPLNVELPFQNFTVRLYRPDLRQWTTLPASAEMNAPQGSFVLFEAAP